MEDINQLYREITKRAKANGVVDQEGWDGIVDEVVEQFRTDGEINDDEETQGCKKTCAPALPNTKRSSAEKDFND